jgi:hypothetical protein
VDTLHTLAIPVVREELDDQSAVFFRLAEVAFPFASSLEVDAAKQPAGKFRVLARTSSSSSTASDAAPALSPLSRPPPQHAASSGPAIVALSVEGRLTSAFGTGVSIGTSRVLVVASSQFLANPFARAGNAPAASAMQGLGLVIGGDEQLLQLAGPYAQTQLTSTILVFKNTLDWLAMDDDLATCTLPVGGKDKKGDKGGKDR